MFDNFTAMVVDKSIAIEKIIASILLDQLGFHQVISANNPEEAAKLINSGAKVDIIVSSWDFGDSTAEVLLKEIRRGYETHPIPFILMTKDSSDTFLVKAFKAGITEFILKPFKPEDLTKAIHMVAKGSERRKAVRYKTREQHKVVMKFGKTAAYSGTLLDISTGGMMVKTTQFMQNPVNIFDQAEITLYAGAKPIEARGELRRMEPDTANLSDKTSIRAAFMFTSVDGANMQKLLDFIEKQRPDIPEIVGLE